MNKADWMTAGGAVVGILGIGVGLWWADAVAALFIAASIVRDGVTNLRMAVAALMDARASTYDGAKPHPLLDEIDGRLEAAAVGGAGPVAGARPGPRLPRRVLRRARGRRAPSLAELREAREAAVAVDWKVQDLVVVPVEELPAEFLPGVREEVAGHDAGR